MGHFRLAAEEQAVSQTTYKVDVHRPVLAVITMPSNLGILENNLPQNNFQHISIILWLQLKCIKLHDFVNQQLSISNDSLRCNNIFVKKVHAFNSC